MPGKPPLNPQVALFVKEPGMQKFTTLEGVAAPLKMINIDTDMI